MTAPKLKSQHIGGFPNDFYVFHYCILAHVVCHQFRHGHPFHVTLYATDSIPDMLKRSLSLIVSLINQYLVSVGGLLGERI